jgi:hypothetical protein
MVGRLFVGVMILGGIILATKLAVIAALKLLAIGAAVLFVLFVALLIFTK